jgi:hypothetical protein
MTDMTKRRREMWIDLVTTFIGEECIKDVMAHPSEPGHEMQTGDVILGDTLSEEERFLYQLIPTDKNCTKVLASSCPSIIMLWDLWWNLVAINHHIFGSLGVRKGWMLVQPKQKNTLDEFAEELRRSLGLEEGKVMEGRFEFKDPNSEKPFLS